MKLTSIDGYANKPNPDLIEHIEYLLDLAKRGEIHAMCYVVGWDNTRVDGGMCMDPHRQVDPDKLIGALFTILTNLSVQNALMHSESALLDKLREYFIER